MPRIYRFNRKTLLRARLLRRALFWLVEFVILFGFWLLYVDKIDWPEVSVGIFAAALAATGTEAVRGLRFARFYPYQQWLLLIWRVPGTVLVGCWMLIKFLWLRYVYGRDVHGELKTVAFDPGGNDPRSAARRALAIIFTSIAPNSIVLTIDHKEHLMLFHQILGNDVPTVTKKLGARV